MEAGHSPPADGKRSGGQQQPLSEPPISLPQSPVRQSPQLATSRPAHGSLGRHQHRQPKRSDLHHRLQQQQSHVSEGGTSWQLLNVPGPSRGSLSSSPLESSSNQLTLGHGAPTQSTQERPEVISSKRERKPQKPGKYVCTYCGRPCAKPSVLQKHIRSHTGERPYPCVPCGFSFKTKSNLYKHRKSHAHRIKAGQASSRDEHSLSGPESSTQVDEHEEPSEGESTDSEDETGQHRSSTSQDRPTLKKSSNVELSFSEESQRTDDSQAVKQRLAMRLSERKRVPRASPDEPSSSLGPGSKGSTESGYFSRSGSAELSQVSPPSANAKSYAEIILGKYGRLGQQQRSPHQSHPQPSSSSLGKDEKSVPFNVPKTQVIEHITKLITINEAVVDTSEIDSVKPRRSSISRRSSIESPKFSLPKDPNVFDPKGDVPGSSSSTGFGVFADEFQCSHVPDAEALACQVPSTIFMRSQSMPSTAGQDDPASTSSHSFRLSHSFDEQQAAAAEMRVGSHHRMLRRQPAIEVPLGPDFIPEETCPSTPSVTGSDSGWKQNQGQRLYECEACGIHYAKRESYEAHRVLCMDKFPQKETSTFCEDRPQMMHHKFRAIAMAVRKRRKEESLEEDPQSPGPAAVSINPLATTSVPGREDNIQGFSGALSQVEPERKGSWKEISVIQHTSSFEKQESMSTESQEAELKHQPAEQQAKPTTTSRLIRQPNIQVPEILVTWETDTEMVSPPASTSTSKESEKAEEFQWPQRSQSLAQLPAEKLPPKKKRLRLTEAAQSSGESSFESVSLPRSPSQESNVSHTSSRSASFEESGKPDSEMQTVTWSSQGSHMLTVPSGLHQHHHSHREMRRSASEQAPASPPHPSQIVEVRSKSFDYGSLSPQHTSASWRERRKCLLVKHATLGEPEQEEPFLGPSSKPGSPNVCQSYPSHHELSIGEHSVGSTTSRLSAESVGKTLQLFQGPVLPLPLHPTSPESYSSRQLTKLLPVTTAISEVLSSQIIQHALLQTTAPPLHSAQLHVAERLGLPLQQLPTLFPLQYSSGLTQAVYFPVSGGLTIQVPHSGPPYRGSRPSPPLMPSPGPSHQHLVPHHHPRPTIAPCLEQLAPVVSIVVPVRLQTHIPTYANAMYTTLSQILVTTQSQVPICCTAMVIMGKLEEAKPQRSYLKLPSLDSKSCIPMSLPLEFSPGTGSDEGYGPLGAGGSKRMLSPAGSLELSTEAQRHQKRVKEEDDKEREKEEEEKQCNEKALEEDQGKDKGRKTLEAVLCKERKMKVKETEELQESKENSKATAEGKAELLKKEEKEEESHGCTPRVASPERAKKPSYPSLHTSTSVSWCYLNYIKPNPSAQRDPQTSVYSSWSVSMHNPNLPGFSTKMVLSLLRSKQKHSSECYTMATAPSPTTGKLVTANNRKPKVSEVCVTPPSTPARVKEEPLSEQEEKKEKSGEETPSTSKQIEPPRIQIFEGGYKSNEEYVYVRGRGRGKYVCGECGIRCKKPSMLKKHIRTHTDVRPYVCKHCNFAFKTKGNLTKHMKSKAHGKKCQEMGISESSMDELEAEEAVGSEEQVCESEEQEEHQFSDVEDSEDDDNNEDEEDEEYSSHEDPPSSCSTDTRPSTGGRSDGGRGPSLDNPDPTGPEKEDVPSPRKQWPSGQAASPSSKRALFSRKGWKASPRGFSPGSEGSPLRSPSPRLDLSSPNRHLSPSPERGPSPIRALSPIRPLSPLQPLSPGRYRSSRALLSPTPLRPQHRPHSSPAHLPWDSASKQASVGHQEKTGTPREGLIFPDPCLLPPALRLSPNESSAHIPPRAVDVMFSHLPLHSQDNARMPYHMIPIGGIQMVQARPRSRPKLERGPSSTPSPTSPKEDLPFSPARTDTTPWGSYVGTNWQSTHLDSWLQSQEEGAGQSGLCSPSTSSTLPKPLSLQPCTGKRGAKDKKQYGSLYHSTKTHTLVPEKTDQVTTDTDEGVRKASELSPGQTANLATQRTRQPYKRESAESGQSRERGSDVSEGEKSANAGKCQGPNPKST
ncbi:transcription factor HIVEP3 [Chanos chanos]|uniref:Transcription factor HIVEP3 n=1 Tax=Chanos chanos TaxID=29144 RepID=A0A6J2W333_CHACN|nr:transcription factor HIVEP3-like [Chanos chanos]